jgi:hypothetical protein
MQFGINEHLRNSASVCKEGSEESSKVHNRW